MLKVQQNHVRYSATLNDVAAFRNINNAYLEYSNNPNGEGTGTTVSDDVTAFTFTMDIDKVDEDGNALDGAGFTLYKKAEDGYVQFGDEITGDTKFSFSGLAVGDYKLVESTTPDGYNTMEDLEFSVVADSMEDADGNAYVTGLKIVAQGGTLDSDLIEGWTVDTDTGILSADIANYKGSELPSTGGMGTMIFYVVGGYSMVGHLIDTKTGKAVLINQRAVQSEEKYFTPGTANGEVDVVFHVTGLDLAGGRYGTGRKE